MDEPCSALDPIATNYTISSSPTTSRTAFYSDANVANAPELKDGSCYTIVIVTHNMQQAARASDRHRLLGSDLRLLAALLHLGITFERMGDQAVNIARIAEITQGLPRADKMLERIQEMGDLVRPMIHTAIHSFARRDVDEARLLPAMDEPVDRLNRTMYREVIECGKDPELLEWATQMMLVSRALERVGDQAVDVGEQLAFLVTGEFAEWSQHQVDVSGDS
jgi:phosphate uptake regulator